MGMATQIEIAFCNTDLSISDSEISILGGSADLVGNVQSAGDVMAMD